MPARLSICTELVRLKQVGANYGSRGSILFIHGAGHGAWCWREHFTHWFMERGYTVSAPDLPGHGELDRGELMRIPLNSHVQAVAAAAGSLSRPLTLIGHSMGGFIVQRYLETSEADLAILLASTPPTGALGLVKRMATHRPIAFLRTMITSEATDSEDRTRDYFFSSVTPASVVTECHRRLQPESRQVLRDMMRALHPERVKTPVVVMGAEHDWLVAPARELLATARAFGTIAQTLPGGHDMMLDFAWEHVAGAIDSAIVSTRHGSHTRHC